MKKGLIIMFAAFAVLFAALGFYNRCSVDVLDLQWKGFSYYEALSIEAEAHTVSVYMFVVSFLSACMAYMTPKFGRME